MHCKFGACQKWEPAGRIWKFLNVFAKSPLLPSIPHRSRLFWLNSHDIMEFSSWKRFIMWSMLYFAVQRNSRASIVLNRGGEIKPLSALSWMQFVLQNCEKLLSDVCMIIKQCLIVLFVIWCIKSIKVWLTRHQICFQDFGK